MSNEIAQLDLSGEFTGRYLMVTTPDASKETLKEMKNVAGLDMASSEDFSRQAGDTGAMDTGDGIYLNEIGVAVITGVDEDQLMRLSGSSMLRGGLESLDIGSGPLIERERVVYALENDFGSYLQGYRDAVNHLNEKFGKGLNPATDEKMGEVIDALASLATYGLRNTKVVVSPPYTQLFSGKGIKVAVLDTGLDLTHPDFGGRSIFSKSFVPGEAVQDRNSHGTHCIGTACGPLNPTEAGRERYGVAYDSIIYAGKVLSNAGRGADGWILGGINWAVANKCQVISMSLGAPVSIGSSGYSAVYENAAKAALNAGSLIIAAAGNDYSQPVSHPAYCPSIMAVAAVDNNNIKANFSNITFYPPHGKVDIAAPGVNTLSTIPLPGKYGYKNGTSMATPHVAGIAALWAESNGILRGTALWQKLVSSALAIPQPVNHVGSGLAQAPVSMIKIKKPDLLPKLPKTPIKKKVVSVKKTKTKKKK